jgi:predicted acetyltransferase
MIVYETKGFEKEMKIVEFLYLDDIGKYMILQYLYTHKDQFSEIHLRLMDRDQPELWVLDTKLRIKNRDWVPSPMGRILDVSGMSGMEVGEGTVKINVTDSHCDWNTGSWELVSENGKLHVNPIPSGEIDMTISGLSALVYGVYEIGDLQVKGELSQTDQSYQLSSLFPKLSTSLFSLF